MVPCSPLAGSLLQRAVLLHSTLVHQIVNASLPPCPCANPKMERSEMPRVKLGTQGLEVTDCKTL
jgi:hypothetical protein